jgi:hypothetical protein
MSWKKRKPESFDVAEFLRESDDDLKSALHSLLRSPVVGRDQRIEEGIEVLPHTGFQPGSKHSLEAASGSASLADTLNTFPVGDQITPPPLFSSLPGIELSQPVVSDPVPARGRPESWIPSSQTPTPAIQLIPSSTIANTQIPVPIEDSNQLEIRHLDINPSTAIPGINLIYRRPEDAPSHNTVPGINLTPQANKASEPKRRQFPIREMRLAQDAHTRAEQQIYEALWENAKVYDDISKTITIGFGAMARMVRLAESNARINVRNLIAKLAVEEMGNYNCEYAIGRTYRIFNYSEIQRRRRQAGLTWYMRRTLAVVFVDPVTKEPLDLGPRKHIQQGSLNSLPGPNLIPDPGIKLGPAPGPNLIPLLREKESSKKLLSESSSSALHTALSTYGVVDDDAITRLRQQTLTRCPDCTEEEIIHFVHAKGALLRKPESRITNPIGFLLTAIPKCFEGQSLHAFRTSRQETTNRSRQELAEQNAKVDAWRREQQAILDNPEASDDQRYWARKWLLPDDSSD